MLLWAEEASNLGLHLIDAPITGGAHRALDGTLCYMVGGSVEQLAQGSPVFQTSAEKIVHAGPVGCGIALKLCNNFIQYTEFVAMVEATRLAEACGLSVEVLRDVGLSNGVVNQQMFMFASGRNAVVKTTSEEDMDAYFGAMGRLGEKIWSVLSVLPILRVLLCPQLNIYVIVSRMCLWPKTNHGHQCDRS